MHSALNRAQAVFGFFTTVALFVAGFAALSVLLYPTDAVTADVKLRDVKVIKGRPHYYSTKREEYAQMRFDLDADLTPLFNWNTKQLFVYVYATYSSAEQDKSDRTPPSQSIIWDTIIEAPESPYTFAKLRERFFPANSKSLSPKRNASPKSKKNQNQKKKKDEEKGKAESVPGRIRLRDQKSKYQISDITGKMAERSNVTLAVGWNVQPWVGALWWAPGTGAVPRTEGSIGQTEAFDFPVLKGSKPKGDGEKAADV